MQLRTLANTLVVAALWCTTADATAQAGFEGGTPCARASRLESNVECEARVGRTVVIEHDLVTTIQVEGITAPTRQCQAEVTLSYAQNNTLASVDGTIDNATCGASSGSLVLSVTTANESGERTSQEFTQAWMREDDQPVTFSADYPIGKNVELVRVRAPRIRCTCAQAPQADTPEALP